VFVLITRAKSGKLKATLEEPDDCTRFHLRAQGVGPVDAGAALENEDIGTLTGDDAYLRPDAIRRLAAGRTGSKWDDRFESMVAYARSKGWVSENGAIQAHCDWA
jgi:hypothetical protein